LNVFGEINELLHTDVSKIACLSQKSHLERGRPWENVMDREDYFASPKELKYLPVLSVETGDVLSRVLVVGKATMKAIYLGEIRED